MSDGEPVRWDDAPTAVLLAAQICTTCHHRKGQHYFDKTEQRWHCVGILGDVPSGTFAWCDCTDFGRDA